MNGNRVKLTNRSLIFHKDEESEIVWSALVSDIQMLEDCKDKRDIRVSCGMIACVHDNLNFNSDI